MHRNILSFKVYKSFNITTFCLHTSLENMDETSNYNAKELEQLALQLYDKKELNSLMLKEMNRLTCVINGFSEGVNITTNIIKKFQRIPTQQKLDSFHITMQEDNKKKDKYMRDINLYRTINDFIDLSKPHDFVIVKFKGDPREFCVKYKKTQTLAIPWLTLWFKIFPNSVLEYCTDINTYARLFGSLCSLINISNLLNRIESKDVNYTLILLSLVVYPNSDMSPISRNATPEVDEILKSVIYEDCQRKMNKIKVSQDKLLYSRTRNMFNLPSLQGSNFKLE